MQEVEAMEFFDRVVGEDDDQEPDETVILEHESGAALEVAVVELERNQLMDELSQLPDEMLEVLAGANDAEEATEEADEENLLSSVDGDTSRAFESICGKGLRHPKLTSDNIEMIVSEFDFDVLFGLGAKVLEVSLGNTGSVTGFHEPGSDENSS
jgi:hypothetical protein